MMMMMIIIIIIIIIIIRSIHVYIRAPSTVRGSITGTTQSDIKPSI